MEHYDSNRGGNVLPALLLGFGLGVLSTVIYAAAREEKFNRVVKKTQDVGHKVYETADHWRDNIQHAGEKLAQTGERVREGVKNAVANVRGRAESAVEEVQDKASQIARDASVS
jgi:gas vesicle protein